MNTTDKTPGQVFLHHLIENSILKFPLETSTIADERNRPYVLCSFKLETEIWMRALAESYVAQCPTDAFDVVFGPVSLSMSFSAMISKVVGRPIGYAYEKVGRTVGVSLADKKVLIIENPPILSPIPMRNFEFVKENGGTPVCCLIPFDSQEQIQLWSTSSVQEFEETTGIPVRTGGTFSDLIDLMQSELSESIDHVRGKFIERLLTYQKQYGV